MPVPRTIYLLMFDAFGRGGVARSVLTLASRLADRHQVEVISLYRRRAAPRFPLDPRVRLSVLRDARGHEGLVWRALHQRPSRLSPEPSETEMSLLTDLLLRRKLCRLRPGILVSTRPSLHLAAARFAPGHVSLVGQDHAPFTVRFANARQVDVLRAAVPALDAYTVLTDADAADYRRELPGCAERISTVPNMLPWPVADAPAPLDGRLVVAAGRLSKEKGFRRLLRAFAPVAQRHPGWRLRIHGEGEERAGLEALVRRLGLERRVELPGHTDDLRSALAEASVYALSSHHEGFGMSLVEAMSLGVPPVSFACPQGPAQIVDHGANGMLVEDGDLAGFSETLDRLVTDDALRRRLGARAWQDARAYAPERVLGDWEDLFDRVALRHTAARAVAAV
jgi:glycosyltransferase involved in cell wall biosynthesis